MENKIINNLIAMLIFFLKYKMPIDFNSSINKVSTFTFGSPILNTLLNSPFAVSFAISVMCVVLIMFLYPAKSGTPIMTLVRLFIYTLLSTTLLVFLHDGVRSSIHKENNTNKKDEELMRGITNKDKELYNLIGQKSFDSPEITNAAANNNPNSNNLNANSINPNNSMNNSMNPNPNSFAPTDKIQMNGVLGGSEMKSFGTGTNIYRAHLDQFANA